jgi:serine/threonine-protein kinase
MEYQGVHGGYSPLDSFATGTVVAKRYRLTSLIAQGGMGAVFKAIDETTGIPVAIKILFCPYLNEVDRYQVLRRFEREAQLVKKIKHPNVVRVLDYEFHEDVPCLVMELVQGINLREYFDQKKQLSPEAVLVLVEQISKALTAAHELFIVHRDLKPSNILLAGDAVQGLIVKVADFGVAKTTKSNNDETDLTLQGKVIGTPAYMSPEQVQGEDVDPRSDVYSLAVLTFELLTGFNPFFDTSFAKSMLKHIHEPTPSLSKLAPDVSVTKAVDRVLQKAMAKEPEDRIATVDEFFSLLSHAIVGKRKKRKESLTGRLRRAHLMGFRGMLRRTWVMRIWKQYFSDNFGVKLYGLLFIVPVIVFLSREIDTTVLTRGLNKLFNILSSYF